MNSTKSNLLSFLMFTGLFLSHISIAAGYGILKKRDPETVKINVEHEDGEHQGIYLDADFTSVSLEDRDSDGFGIACELRANIYDIQEELGISPILHRNFFTKRFVPNQEFKRLEKSEYDIRRYIDTYPANSPDPNVPRAGARYSLIVFPLRLKMNYPEMNSDLSHRSAESLEKEFGIKPDYFTTLKDTEEKDAEDPTLEIRFELACEEYIRVSEDRDYLYMHEIENIWAGRISFE